MYYGTSEGGSAPGKRPRGCRGGKRRKGNNVQPTTLQASSTHLQPFSLKVRTPTPNYPTAPTARAQPQSRALRPHD